MMDGRGEAAGLSLKFSEKDANLMPLSQTAKT